MKRNMITEEIRTELFKKQDLKYKGYEADSYLLNIECQNAVPWQ